jgi:hypothetical protein
MYCRQNLGNNKALQYTNSGGWADFNFSGNAHGRGTENKKHMT